MSPPATATDLAAELLRTLEVLRRGDPAPVEIRLLKTKQKTVSGYYTDPDALVRDVARWDGTASVYIVMNPIVADLLARSINHLTPWAEYTTADAEVQRRHWLLIDVDPVRPRGIAASEAELAHALVCRDTVVHFLETLGFPEPAVARSGNGGHGLYGVDLPNDEAATELLRRGLQALAARFDEPGQVVLDTAVFNAARVTKLYGTVAVKGDATAERPHRRSRLESVPTAVQNVPRAALEALAAMAPAAEARGWSVWNGHGPTSDLVAVFRERGWHRRALGRGRHAVTCPWASEHSIDSGMTETLLYEPSADNGGAGGFKCMHAHCAARSVKDVYALLRAEGEATPGARGATVEDPAPPPPAPETWPQLASEALYGPVGRLVETISPHTEADPAATLAHTIAAIGNLIGRGPHAVVEYAQHPLQFFFGIVGSTAKARKGLSWSAPRHVAAQLDPEWARTRIRSGLSTSEGLIFNVRDPTYSRQPIKQKGRTVDHEIVMTDEGEADKRLFIIESELAVVLRRMARESSALSATLRDGWDTGNLSTLTRTNPLRATGAHITLIAHITQEELRRYLNLTETANGFANRFVWLLVRRARLRPEGEAIPDAQLTPRVAELQQAVARARTLGPLARDPDAAALWNEVLYPKLTAPEPGLVGAVISRADPHVLRLSTFYAALDGAPLIRPAHLLAAVALWEFAAHSARLIFGGLLGDPVADLILDALRRRGPLAKTALFDLFARNRDAADIGAGLARLEDAGLVRRQILQTGGRPKEVWACT
jgi:hypothetical protein